MIHNRMTESGRHVSDWSNNPDQDALDPETIALLSDRLIEQMTHSELIRVVRASGHPWRRRLLNLEYAARPDLKRMTFLARYCCQNLLARELNRLCR